MKKWIVIALLITGCSKDPQTVNDTQLPVITISTPTAGQLFSNGQSITISGSITDDNYIAEVHIHVSNASTGVLLMDVHMYPAGSSMNFNQSITATTGTNYKIQVLAKDKAVNQATNTVEVTCN